MRSRRLIAVCGAVGAVAVAIALGVGGALASTVPVVSTGAASAVGASSATLAGTVNPEGQATAYAFQWGLTASYGFETPLPAVSAGSGSAAISVSATLSSLAGGTVYHYRVIAISSAGTAVGADESFTTSGSPPAASAAPTASTGTASAVGQAGATLAGTVNPQGNPGATSYWFEWGPTVNYGYQSAAVNAGTGSADVATSATLTGLASSTTYHYRVVASNPGGITLGADATFTTTTPPSVATGGPIDIAQTAATLTGTVNPLGQSASYYFQYGPTSSYTLQTPPAHVGSGSGNVAVSQTASGLAAASSYHYRIVATSAGGTSYGADQTLKTATTSSTLGLYGQTAFVSPGGVAGVFVACIGPASCTGSLTITHSGTTIGSRSKFTLAANDGGFVHVTLTSAGRGLVADHKHALTSVTVRSTTGSTATQAITIVPFQ